MIWGEGVNGVIIINSAGEGIISSDLSSKSTVTQFLHVYC
jgi:hypothetical protein